MSYWTKWRQYLLHRKSLILPVNGRMERRPRQRERGTRYKADVTEAIRAVAESLDPRTPDA